MIASTPSSAADQNHSPSAGRMTKQTPDPLTKRQRQVYEHLKAKIEEDGYAPSVREMCDFFDISSPNGIICHLVALQKKGLIERTSHRSRAIRLVDQAHSTSCSLPFYGTAVADAPMQTADTTEQRKNYDCLFEDENLTITVSGNQFHHLGIHDGDELIISRQASETSHYMIAALDQNRHLILCQYSTKGLTTVQDISETPDVKQILGTVMSVVRRFN